MATGRVSRAPSQALGIQEKMMSSLPDIAHPTSRLGNPADIQLSAVNSSQPTGGMITDKSLVRRSAEVPFRVSRSAAVTPRVQAGVHLPPISPGMPVVSASGRRPSIPVIGQKSEVIPRAETAHSESTFSGTSSVPDYQSKLKLEVDELLANVRRKVNDNFYAVRNAFVAADIDGVGSVTREQCHRVLMTLMGRTISLKHFNHLLVRVGLADKAIIGYSQFYTAFREKESTEAPQVFDSQFKHYAQDKNFLTATQVNALLKEKARQRVLGLGDIIPNFATSDDPNDKGRIIKPELMSALKGNGLQMTEAEFDKLWARFDDKNLGVVDSKVLAKKLGIHFDKNGDRETDAPKTKARAKQGTEVERRLIGQLQKSHIKVRDAFVAFDKKNTGYITAEETLKALKELDIDIKRPVLIEFLTRFGIKTKSADPSIAVLYDDILEKIQEHKYDPPFSKLFNEIRKNELTANITAVEKKLKMLFQPNIQRLMEAFEKLDRLHLLVLPPKDFKEVLEAELETEISQPDFDSMMERTPLDEDGNVKYLDFLDQLSLRNISRQVLEEHDEDADDDSAWEEFDKGRSILELTRAIKLALGDHFLELENFYKTNIDYNTDTGKLTQTQLYNMLNSVMVPELSHGELRTLWRTFHLNQHKTLDYQAFLRHFLYNKKTAAFPSQKMNPPQIGDADLKRRSNNMNSSRDIVFNMLVRKLDVHWDQVRNEMKYLDPQGTGFVSYQQFKNVLTELQVELDPYELKVLCEKFDTNRDSRVNYLALLEQFCGWTRPSNIAEIFSEKTTMRAPDVQEFTNLVADKMQVLTARLREKLAGEMKNLKKAFRKLDDQKSGYLTISEFRSVLELSNVALDEEEAFHLAAKYDDKLTGKLKYDQFLRDLQKS